MGFFKYLFNTYKKPRFLPITHDEFNALVKRVTTRYKIENNVHASSVIANRMMHLPPEQAQASDEYFGHCVLKNIAFQVAQNQGSRIAHENQIDELIQHLHADKNNNQARDAIVKAINDGSPYAAAALKKFEEGETTLTLVSSSDNKTTGTITPIMSNETA